MAAAAQCFPPRSRWGRCTQEGIAPGQQLVGISDAARDEVRGGRAGPYPLAVSAQLDHFMIVLGHHFV